MKHIVLALSCLFLLGCPKTITVTCQWTSNGNPSVPVCGTPPCLSSYTLTRQDTGAVIATIPIAAKSYSFSASTQGMSTSNMPVLGLAVNVQTSTGTVSSPKALSSVTVR